MNVGWTSLLGLSTVSAFVAAVTSGAIKLWGDARQRGSEANARREERVHQQHLRAEQAHADARPEYLPRVAAVLDWIEHEALSIYDGEVDYTGEFSTKPELASVVEVIRALRDVEKLHPTSEVRLAAGALRSRIDGFYNDYDPNRAHADPEQFSSPAAYRRFMEIEPSLDQMRAWLKDAEQLVELVHLPPVDDDRSVLPQQRPETVGRSNERRLRAGLRQDTIDAGTRSPSTHHRTDDFAA